MTSREADKVTTIDLLRHGACEGGEIYRGTTDVALSKEGRSQMAEAIGSQENWQQIITSPLRRCREFASELAQAREVPISVAHDLREMDFGEWEGRLVSDVWRDDEARVLEFYNDPLAFSPPRGETVTAVAARAATAWNALTTQYCGQHLLMVIHGGVIRVLLCHLLDMPLTSWARLHVPYATRVRLRIYHTQEGVLPLLVSMQSAESQE